MSLEGGQDEMGLQPENHSEAFSHLRENFDGSGCSELYAPDVPIQTFDVIG